MVFVMVAVRDPLTIMVGGSLACMLHCMVAVGGSLTIMVGGSLPLMAGAP